MNKAAATLLLVGLCLYAGSYGVFRMNHQIIHRTMAVNGKTTLHSIQGGDAALGGAAINGSIAAFYSPLRWLEEVYWHIQDPVLNP